MNDNERNKASAVAEKVFILLTINSLLNISICYDSTAISNEIYV